MADRDLHHRPQDDLVLLRLSSQPLGDEAFEVPVELPGSGLPQLQVADRVLDLDRLGVGTPVGRDEDLAAVVLDVALGVGVVVLQLHQQLRGQVDQLGSPGDSPVAELLTVITHRLGKAVARLVRTGADPLELGTSCGSVVVHGGAPASVLLLLGPRGHPEGAHRLR
ncbi:hypothetical protein [Nocardia lijiangensis]|uniref:hypothetical protein n=1 Tax=Nocardia lijiangensis TaxID=299618 RepID=UPI00082AAC14|nr:hypothetical protein [Nocardia lijiangensis]